MDILFFLFAVRWHHVGFAAALAKGRHGHDS